MLCARGATSSLGFRAFIAGGKIKYATDAVIGEEALKSFKKYHFTKAFWGARDISRGNGFTMPETSDAMLKKAALRRSLHNYVAADAT